MQSQKKYSLLIPGDESYSYQLGTEVLSDPRKDQSSILFSLIQIDEAGQTPHTLKSGELSGEQKAFFGQVIDRLFSDAGIEPPAARTQADSMFIRTYRFKGKETAEAQLEAMIEKSTQGYDIAETIPKPSFKDRLLGRDRGEGHRK